MNPTRQPRPGRTEGFDRAFDKYGGPHGRAHRGADTFKQQKRNLLSPIPSIALGAGGVLHGDECTRAVSGSSHAGYGMLRTTARRFAGLRDGHWRCRARKTSPNQQSGACGATVSRPRWHRRRSPMSQASAAARGGGIGLDGGASPPNRGVAVTAVPRRLRFGKPVGAPQLLGAERPGDAIRCGAREGRDRLH